MRMYATVAIAATLSLAALSCADAPTQPQPERVAPNQAPSTQRGRGGHGRADALTNVAVTMPAKLVASGVEGVFRGTFTATRVDVITNSVTGKRELQVFGTLTGAATVGSQVINVPATAVSGILSREEGHGNKSNFRPTQASCDILFLDLGPIHLDLLGLVLDVSQIIIDLDAVTGGGNLLGNLLCGLLGLLDIPGLLGAISNLLDLINQILGGIGGAGAPLA